MVTQVENNVQVKGKRRSISAADNAKQIPMALWTIAVLQSIVAIALLLIAIAKGNPGYLATFALIIFTFSAASFVLASLVQKFFENQRKLSSILKQRAKQQEVAPLTNTDTPLLEDMVSALNSIFTNISEQKHGSLEILASNRLLAKDIHDIQQMLDSVEQGIIVISAANRVLFANRATAPFMTVSTEQATGKIFNECTDIQKVLDLIEPREGDRIAMVSQSIELDRDAERDWEYVSVDCFRNQLTRKQMGGQVLIFQDMTGEKARGDLRTDFIDSVAHELRTPLNAILGYAGMMLNNTEGQNSSDNIEELCNIIFQESSRLSELIDNFLNISMMENGAAQLNTNPTRLKKLIEDSIKVVLSQAEKNNVTIIDELPDRLPVLNIDKQLINMAVVNILSNAVKYTPDGGTVTLSASSTAEHLQIKVQDSGIGINADDLTRIFEKFFRCANPETGQVSGSGIGLATALQIMQLHGGRIEVQSQVGEGSSFSLIFPTTLINQTLSD